MVTVRCVGVVCSSQVASNFVYEHVPLNTTVAKEKAVVARCRAQLDKDGPPITDGVYATFDFVHDDAATTHWANRGWDNTLIVRAFKPPGT